MKVLLDTHTLLWWLDQSPKLSQNAKIFIQESEEALVSAVSAYEIAIKARTGKLTVPRIFIEDFRGVMTSQNFGVLPITPEHASAAGDLPLLHRDPFDRLLVAQTRLEKLTLVTRDEKLSAFSIPVFW